MIRFEMPENMLAPARRLDAISKRSAHPVRGRFDGSWQHRFTAPANRTQAARTLLENWLVVAASSPLPNVDADRRGARRGLVVLLHFVAAARYETHATCHVHELRRRPHVMCTSSSRIPITS